jgi:hypothetical protein
MNGMNASGAPAAKKEIITTTYKKKAAIKPT